VYKFNGKMDDNFIPENLKKEKTIKKSMMFNFNKFIDTLQDQTKLLLSANISQIDQHYKDFKQTPEVVDSKYFEKKFK
jgi:hypothetical protein